MHVRFWQTVSSGTLAIALCTPAAAQTPATEAEGSVESDIVVTARKRDELIQDVPAVVSAVSGELVDQLGGAPAARDIVALLPGITFIESAQGPTAEPNIRGAGQARLPNSDSAVGLYRNGAYIAGGNLGGRTFQRFDLFDMQRTESLRGPQGALYGRNAVGGAINVISRRPEFDQEGEVEFIAGSERTYGAQAIFNTPLSDTVAVRGGFDSEYQDGGFYRDATNTRIVDKERYFGARLGLRYRPSESFDAVLMADYSDESGFGGTAIPRIDPDGDEFRINEGTPQLRAAEQYSISLNAVWRLEGVDLTSVTSYRNRQSQLTLDNDGGTALNEINFFDDSADTFFQELRANGESGRLNWLVGADFFHLADTYFTPQSGRAIIPATMTMAAVNPNFTQTVDFENTSYSAFASLDYEIVDGFTLGAEGRYSIDEKSAEIVALRADGTPRYTDFPPNSPASTPSETFKNFNWGVTASYAFTPDILAFARVATAYRAGGFNAELGNPCGVGEVPGSTCNVIDVPPRYGEEHSINYEVGLKTSWLDRRLTLNANLYRLEYDDLLVNLTNGIMPMVDPLNGAMFLANAGDAHAWGYEIEMAFNPRLPDGAGTLRLAANYAEQHGEFDTIAPTVTTVLPGFALARLRPTAVSGNVYYRVPVGERAGLFFAGNYIYEEGGFQNGENTFRLDTIDRFNLRVGIDWDNWQLAGRVTNLFNTRSEINRGGTVDALGLGTEYRRNDPRAFEISLRYRW